MIIREFIADDRAQLEKCIRELQIYIAEIDPIHRVRHGESFNERAYVENVLKEVQTHEGKVFVAEDEGMTIGCIIGIIPKNSELDLLDGYESKDGRILELIVTHNQRGKGTGGLLMEKMEEYFRDQGCSGVFVDVFAPNKKARLFYEKEGYAERLHTMLKIL